MEIGVGPQGDLPVESKRCMAMSQFEPIFGQSCQDANSPPDPSERIEGLRLSFVEEEISTPDCVHKAVPLLSSRCARKMGFFPLTNGLQLKTYSRGSQASAH